MSNIIPFKFNQNDVRVVTGKEGEFWFIAKDVAELLGYSNTRKAIRDHCKGAKIIGGNELFLPSFDPQTKIKLPHILVLCSLPLTVSNRLDDNKSQLYA